ncbi:hypothetical protein ACIRSS_49160 [Amycolatopsis sp. NPDC101161]|uniref:hypothetical protein n=1 Tax=Amycolatopsis sp. NPDC101161 TaxID=3363940 RepID=UPI003817ACD1
MAATAESVSDPSSPDYNPRSPLYDVTADSSSKYYVGPLKTDNSPSGDEIREMATREIDDEIRAGWLGPAVDPVLRDKKIQELYQQHLDDAKHGLDEGLAMRENGGAPKTLWANASHEQMNDAITQDANPATVAETSEEWVAVGNDLGTHQKTLADAINASTNNWQGDAGDAVREHLAGVGKWLGSTAQGATLAGRQQEIHSQALNETQRQMVANPPVQFDLQSTNQKLMSMTDPVQYAAAAGEAMQTYRAQQAAREHAAQIMTQYDETIGAAVATPRFPAPPKLPTATATAQRQGTAAGGAGAGGAQPLMARTAMDPALDPTAAGRTPAGLNAAGLDGAGGPGGSGAGGSGSFGGAGIPGGGSGGEGSGFSGSGIPGGGSGIPGGGSGIPGGGAGGSGFSGAGIPAASGGGGAGGPGFSGAGIPEIPGGSFTGSGIPGSSVPGFDDSTTSSGFTPSGIGGSTGGSGGYTPPSIPNIPDVSGGGGGVRGGSPIPGFTPPGIDPITGLPTGTGPGGIPGGGSGLGKMPTIGRGGGINGESIASRLGGIGGGSGGGSLGGIGGGGAGAGGGVGGGVRGTGAGSLGGGAASGAAAEAEAAAARNAGMAGGKAGAAGSPGMGGMGAGRGGKKEDDKEHKAADYLESDDPNFFAGEQAVAPPVIGDWKNQDWK